jgi:hypothetical protein
MGSEEGEKSSSSKPKKIKYKRTGDWGPIPHPSERPTWGRFMYNPEEEKRMADEWRDEGRKTEKRLQEEHVARGNSPTRSGKEESSALDDLRTTYLDPFDGPLPKPKSSTLFISGGYGGGDKYNTKEVKVIKGHKKDKAIGCLTEEESANPDKRTTLVEVTWTPSDPESGREDVTKSFEFDPTERIKGGKRKWTVQCDAAGVPELKEEEMPVPHRGKPQKRGKERLG